MKKAYSYDSLAPKYNYRADYDPQVIANALDLIHEWSGGGEGFQALEIGSGTGYLTRHLLNHPQVNSVLGFEPSQMMIAHSLPEVRSHQNFKLFHGPFDPVRMQGQKECQLVAFGSSFNLVSQTQKEAIRKCLPTGAFALITYNHRDLSDPLQKAINGLLQRKLNYDPGERRKEQGPIIEQSGMTLRDYSEGSFLNPISKEDFILGWASHGTVQSQSGEAFHEILDEIRNLVHQAPGHKIEVPYTTKVWIAEL